MADRPLEGRHALVTGGSSGIGLETVKRLAADGARVAVDYIGSRDSAEQVVGEIEEAGGSAFAVQADVSQEGEVVEMFAEAGERFGAPVDLLVNNAGIEKPFKLVAMPLEEWEKVLAVNLTGPFLCAREAARRLVEARSPGVIVNVSTVHEVVPWPEYSHYCASKGGLKLFGQTIARELAPHGIRVVTVAPGAIKTPINQEMLENEEERRQVEAQTAQGRIGEPHEVAAAIAWLAGPEASYVTGATLLVDGGMALYPGFV